MSNIYKLHIDIDTCLCGECESDTFFLARKGDVIIAYCSNCHSPVINPECSCIIKGNNNETIR